MRLAHVVALALAGVVLAASYAQAQTINACVNKKGVMRIVNDPSQCRSTENPLSWNRDGSPGPPGPPGPPGEQGDPGLDAVELRVVDGEGTDLGQLVDWNTPAGSIDPFVVFYSEAIDGTVKVIRRTGQMEKSWGVSYGLPGCQGPAYVAPALASVLIPVDSYGRFFVGRQEPLVYVSVLSRLIFSGCAGGSGAGSMLPAIEVTNQVSLQFPLTLPLSIVRAE